LTDFCFYLTEALSKMFMFFYLTAVTA